jgi:hypothetical protein
VRSLLPNSAPFSTTVPSSPNLLLQPDMETYRVFGPTFVPIRLHVGMAPFGNCSGVIKFRGVSKRFDDGTEAVHQPHG